GYKLIKNYLAKYGIIFVIEPPFKKTYLDGAAMIYKGRPIIALTLRHKRLDNFWFVLAHELAHLVKHLGKSKNKLEGFVDDLQEQTNINSLEEEADDIANEALIPKSEWEDFKNKMTYSPENIEIFARKIHINPALVAGRIRHETK